MNLLINIKSRCGHRQILEGKKEIDHVETYGAILAEIDVIFRMAFPSEHPTLGASLPPLTYNGAQFNPATRTYEQITVKYEGPAGNQCARTLAIGAKENFEKVLKD